MDKADQLVDEKALFFLWECFSQKILKGFPIRALLLPRVMGRLDTTIRPASPLESIRALAPSTLLQLPGADRTSFKAITTLAKLVPSYHLELGSNLSKIPKVITDLLERMEVA
jgi:hypothetical protein